MSPDHSIRDITPGTPTSSRGSHGASAGPLRRKLVQSSSSGAPVIAASPCAQNVVRALERVEGGEDRQHRELVGAELELGDDAEVPAAATQAPEQLGVLILAGTHDAAVGEDDLGGEQRVDRQAETPHQPADAAPEREPADARVRDHAGRNDEAVRLRAAVDVTEQRAAAHPDPLRDRVHDDVVQRAQVDDEPAVDRRVTWQRMSAAAHGDPQVVLACVGDGGGDVLRRRAAHDQRGRAVVKHVPDGAQRVIVVVAGPDRPAGEFRNSYKFKGIMAEDLAVPLFDLAWLLPRTIGAEGDPRWVLPASELEVMRLLVRRPGVSVNDVAAGLRLQPANVSTTVRSLEGRGLVERRRDEQDGRVVRLHPTALALEHREQQEAAWGEALARALADLPAADAARLREAAPALRALAAALARE